MVNVLFSYFTSFGAFIILYVFRFRSLFRLLFNLLLFNLFWFLTNTFGLWWRYLLFLDKNLYTCWHLLTWFALDHGQFFLESGFNLFIRLWRYLLLNFSFIILFRLFYHLFFIFDTIFIINYFYILMSD